MPWFGTILVAITFANIALASPVLQTPNKRGYSIHESVGKPAKSGPAALADAYRKYNKPVPDDISLAVNGTNNAIAARGTGSVVATPEQYDVEYLCPVTIGNQRLNLDFDTASSDLWVYSSELPAAQQTGHDVYNPTKSSTSKKLPGYTWGSAGACETGDVYTENVTVGGITVTGQAVELAQTVCSQDQGDIDRDGIFGLGFSSGNTVKPKAQLTWLDNAIKEGLLSSNVFTVNLKKGQPGTYDFGYIDSTKYTGAITYTAVDSSQSFWSFISSGYGVGSAFTTQSITGIADTATTLLLLPDAVNKAYYAKVSGAKYDNSQGGYTFPCSATLPNLTIGIGSARLVVPGSYLNYAPVDSTSTTCYGGLQSSAGIGINIFGDVFLKAVFAVFDPSGPRLGFANKKT